MSGLDEDLLRTDPKLVRKKIENFIKKKIKEADSDGVVIGLSGGIDSSTVASLCTTALGAKNVLGLIMRSKSTKTEDIEDAKKLAEKLQMKSEIINMAQFEKQIKFLCDHFKKDDKVAIGNILPRLRMTILYFHANAMNRLVVGTGNKSELLIGYFTKYGDGGADILPIGDLYKTQVRQLAEYLEIPDNIVWKVPTAGLWKNQTDEGEIGVKYDLLDPILCGLIEMKLSSAEVAKKLNASINTVNKILEMTKKNRHKLETPSIAKV